MQADAEHQQHDADFRQLPGEIDIGDEAGGGRADHDAGQQVADQWRHAQARGHEAENQRQPEGCGNGGDEAEVMGHLGAGGEGDPCQMVLAGESFDCLKIGQFRRSTAPRTPQDAAKQASLRGIILGVRNQPRSLRR